MIVGDLDIVRDNLVLHLNTIDKRCYDRLSSYLVNLANISETASIQNSGSFNTTDGYINLNGGTSDYITIDNAYTPGSGFNPHGLQEYSFSLWIKNDSNTGGLVSWYKAPEYSDFGFELELFSGVLYFLFSSGIYATYSYPTTGQWVNMCITYDGTVSGNSNRLKLYINGEQVTLSYFGTIPSSIDANTDTLDIGLIQSGTGDRFITGSFGHLLTYTSTLTSNDVRQNYDSTRNWFL